MPPPVEWVACGLHIDRTDNSLWLVAVDTNGDVWLLKQAATALNIPLNTWTKVTPAHP